jgi:hypothetical protein
MVYDHSVTDSGYQILQNQRTSGSFLEKEWRERTSCSSYFQTLKEMTAVLKGTRWPFLKEPVVLLQLFIYVSWIDNYNVSFTT